MYLVCPLVFIYICVGQQAFFYHSCCQGKASFVEGAEIKMLQLNDLFARIVSLQSREISDKPTQ
ncbi:hypothetical protein M758_7G083300 [Ceratodon purpureus]|uniref:Uncharacterized protein n=1 Tax=Ceratodon purpureus TaxID=3225 RepID=A0A8T0H7Z8_CERPU|nr:hypothetical protein KC19_7G088600 [Ceratodon purpureus]KAG0610675.1 hypothetical protein M758_7G083300 [Ceratodon purpureus]